MNIETYFINSSGLLDNAMVLIQSSQKKTIPLVSGVLDIGIVDIIYLENKYYTIPELGVGGFTNDRGDTITISIDSTKTINEEVLVGNLVHELFHAARSQKIKWTGKTMDRIVEEGLACLFEEIITGCRPIHTETELDPTSIEKLNEEVHANNNEDPNKWLFGFDNVKKWFGYSYGYKLSKDFATKNKLKPSEIVYVKVEDIWSSSGVT